MKYLFFLFFCFCFCVCVCVWGGGGGGNKNKKNITSLSSVEISHGMISTQHVFWYHLIWSLN